MSHGINVNKNGFIPHPYNQEHNAGTKNNWSSGGRSNGAAKLIPIGGFFLVNKINVLHIWKSKYKPQLSSSNIYAMQFQCMNYGFFHVLPGRKILWLKLDQDHHDPMTTNWLFLNEIFLILNENSCFDDNKIFSKTTSVGLVKHDIKFLTRIWFHEYELLINILWVSCYLHN